jgi:RNA polymerase sigma-70 factor (ECF subfamily)
LPRSLGGMGADADDDSLLERLLPVVTGWCTRLCPPGADVDAVAADVLLVLLRRRGELRLDTPIEPWAFAVTRMQVRSHAQRAWYRRWWPGEVRSVTVRTPEHLVGDAETRRRVHEVLATLDEPHRVVLVLCELEDRSRAEVAALLAVPEGTVKSRLRLARVAFRAAAERVGLTFEPGEVDDER